jgi:hypothetical protein
VRKCNQRAKGGRKHGLNRGAACSAVTMTNTSAVVPVVGYCDDLSGIRRGRSSRAPFERDFRSW